MKFIVTSIESHTLFFCDISYVDISNHFFCNFYNRYCI